MAKKSNYVFPIERNTALEVVKIVKNFYLLEGASGEELLAKRSGLSTKLLLNGIGEEVVTQELLNTIYANLNNEEALISIIKETFQSIDYESALFLLRWTKDSQSPYYPRGMGEKPVEQFNEDYDFSKNLFIAYINDHGLIAIKNLPGRVVRVQKEIVKEMANSYRSSAIDEARKILTANQEALTQLRASIKEQKQKIADLKAADENAATSELEAKLNDDRHKAMEQYKIVKGQRRSLRDTLEERAILDRDFADVVGGRTINKAQLDAEREEDDEKYELVRKVLDIVKKTPEALPNPQQALAVITHNIKGMYNETEVKEILGEAEQPTPYVAQNNEQNETYQETNNNDNNNDNGSDDNDIIDTGITQQDTAVQSQEITEQTQEPVVNGTTQDVNIAPVNANAGEYVNNTQFVNTPTPVTTQVAENGTQVMPQQQENGQDVFNAIYDKALEETAEQEQQPVNAQPFAQQTTQVVNNNIDPNNPNV